MYLHTISLSSRISYDLKIEFLPDTTNYIFFILEKPSWLFLRRVVSLILARPKSLCFIFIS